MKLLIRLALAGGLVIAASLVHAKDRSWDATVAKTAEGTYVVGNPDAAAQLTEFVSYSCSHCAHFAKQSEATMRLLLIQPGKLRVEVRHVIRNPVDLAAALATECGPDRKFFANHRLMMLRQDDWLAKAGSATQAQQSRWYGGPVADRMRAIASDLDFYELMEPRGYSRTELDRCLSDEAHARVLANRSQADSKRFGIAGTPSFALNGKLLANAHNWATLQESLKGL